MNIKISKDISKTFDLLKGSGPVEAFFKNPDTSKTRFYEDPETFTKEVGFLNHEGFTCYAGIQPRIEGLNGSATNEGVKVLHRLYIDADPIRPDKKNATDQEKAEALIVAKQIQTDFVSEGYRKPVIADSGNGYWVFQYLKSLLMKPIDQKLKRNSSTGVRRLLTNIRISPLKSTMFMT